MRVCTSVCFWLTKKGSLMGVAEWSDCDLNWKKLSLDYTVLCQLSSTERLQHTHRLFLDCQTFKMWNLLKCLKRFDLLTILIPVPSSVGATLSLFLFPCIIINIYIYIYITFDLGPGDHFLCWNCCQDQSRSWDQTGLFHFHLVSSISSTFAPLLT